jgi:hypothetical protein
MPIREIRDVRDLLIHVIGETLEHARDDGRLRQKYPDLGPDERAVAWILDGMTLHSLRGLIDLRTRQGWTDDPHN